MLESGHGHNGKLNRDIAKALMKGVIKLVCGTGCLKSSERVVLDTGFMCQGCSCSSFLHVSAIFEVSVCNGVTCLLSGAPYCLGVTGFFTMEPLIYRVPRTL